MPFRNSGQQSLSPLQILENHYHVPLILLSSRLNKVTSFHLSIQVMFSKPFYRSFHSLRTLHWVYYLPWNAPPQTGPSFHTVWIKSPTTEQISSELLSASLHPVWSCGLWYPDRAFPKWFAFSAMFHLEIFKPNLRAPSDVLLLSSESLCCVSEGVVQVFLV